MNGLIGKKIGMTQVFREDGIRVPVTLIEAGPCPVLQVKRKDKDGYEAVQLGFGERKERLAKKPLMGHMKKSKAKPVRVIREMKPSQASSCKEGQYIDVSIFNAGDYVDVTGISIGKGFQGGMKRWNWTGGKASHGSMHHRRVGSIGASSFPSRVHKGKHMPGRMGGVQRTVQNLQVVGVEKEKNLIIVKGAVPGNENSYLMIKEAKKIPKKKEQKPENKEQKPNTDDKKQKK